MKSFFSGQPQSFYDFKTHDPNEAQAKRKKLGEKKETLLKTVNQVCWRRCAMAKPGSAVL